MQRCTVHPRHTVVRSCVRRFVGHMCISMTGDIEVLKIGPHAKSDILVKLNWLEY